MLSKEQSENPSNQKWIGETIANMMLKRLNAKTDAVEEILIKSTVWNRETA